MRCYRKPNASAAATLAAKTTRMLLLAGRRISTDARLAATIRALHWRNCSIVKQRGWTRIVAARARACCSISTNRTVLVVHFVSRPARWTLLSEAQRRCIPFLRVNVPAASFVYPLARWIVSIRKSILQLERTLRANGLASATAKPGERAGASTRDCNACKGLRKLKPGNARPAKLREYATK